MITKVYSRLKCVHAGEHTTDFVGITARKHFGTKCNEGESISLNSPTPKINDEMPENRSESVPNNKYVVFN